MRRRMGKWISLLGLCTRKFFFNGSMKANGVVLDEMVVKVGATHRLVAWAFAVQNGLAYMLAPLIMLMMDTFGGRLLCVVGGFLTGLCYFGCGLWVHTGWQLLIMFIISGVGFGLLNYPTYMNVQAHFQERFPTMCAVASLFDFIGVAALPPLQLFMKDAFGFDQSLILFGAIMWHLVAVGVSYKEPSHRRKMATGGFRADGPKAPGSEEKEETGRISSLCVGFTTLYKHRNWTLLLVMDTIEMYIFVAWALFLVSLGTTAGLSEEQAVLLSTVGGVGGLLGKICAIFMFHYDHMNAFTAHIIPVTIYGTCLLGCALWKGRYGLMVLNFVIGVSLGINGTALYGLLPSMVCGEHLPLSVVLAYAADGVTIQLSGVFSGALHDFLGSTVYVYFFIGLLSFLSLPLGFLWACSGTSRGECRSDENHE